MSKENNSKPTDNKVLEPQTKPAVQTKPVNPREELVNSINILISAANIAQSKGVFNLEESHDIWDNIQNIHNILESYQ